MLILWRPVCNCGSRRTSFPIWFQGMLCTTSFGYLTRKANVLLCFGTSVFHPHHSSSKQRKQVASAATPICRGRRVRVDDALNLELSWRRFLLPRSFERCRFHYWLWRGSVVVVSFSCYCSVLSNCSSIRSMCRCTDQLSNT